MNVSGIKEKKKKKKELNKSFLKKKKQSRTTPAAWEQLDGVGLRSWPNRTDLARCSDDKQPPLPPLSLSPSQLQPLFGFCPPVIMAAEAARGRQRCTVLELANYIFCYNSYLAVNKISLCSRLDASQSTNNMLADLLHGHGDSSLLLVRGEAHKPTSSSYYRLNETQSSHFKKKFPWKQNNKAYMFSKSY